MVKEMWSLHSHENKFRMEVINLLREIRDIAKGETVEVEATVDQVTPEPRRRGRPRKEG